MSSVLERSRVALEEMDTLEGAAVDMLTRKTSGAKAAFERDFFVARASKEMESRAQNLKRSYDVLREDVASLRGSSVFANFYGALKKTREYYARHGNNVITEDLKSRLERDAEEVRFSGEEVWGKYVDFSTLHQEFCNLYRTNLDYAAYLRMMLNRPFSSHVEGSNSSQYAKYVKHVDDYLCDFWTRANPLVELNDALKTDEEPTTEEPAAPRVLDLEPFHSHESLVALGGDRLKEGLRALGLKCGGDITARAKRLFSVKGLQPDDIDPRLKKKKTGGKKNDVEEAEKRIELLLAKLGPTIESSLRRAERKFTRTKDELDQELEDEAFGAAQQIIEEEEVEEEKDLEDDDAPPPLYNPKNLPLGWDGKPIPYWLYKLHGLDQTFSCEICGNFTYYGRRAFEQHFTEWRHAHGMRCLRIPNSRHFHGVTKMEDAVALWEQLQERADKERFNAARDEEYEDSDGNVLNRATYEDLARQGLL